MGDVQVGLLEVDGVVKAFGGVVALHEVSLDVTPGQVFAVIGPNGAGKTTLFDIITGITQPDTGTIRFAGEDITPRRADERARRGMARTFQELRLFNNLTAAENIAVGKLWRGRARLHDIVLGLQRDRRERADAYALADELLRRLGIAHRRDVAAGLLSHGEKRLVEIGRALALDPSVLILDEPTAGLNAPNKLRFVEEILPAVRERVETVLLIEHDMDIVMGISDRVAVLAHGRKIAEGPPEAVQSDPDVIREYFGS